MDSLKTVKRTNRQKQFEFTKNALWYAAYFLCGIVISRGAVLGTLAPFGASFAAAAPKKYLFPSLIGTAFGYVLLNPRDSFRYLAVIVTIGGIRWLFGSIERISQSRIFAPITAFVPILATGAALLFGSTSTLSSFADCVIEAVIAAAAAYFIGVTVRLSQEKRSLTAYTQQESASLVMTGCVLILAFGSITYENISLGRIIAVIIVLLYARYGGVNGGTVSGVSTGAIFSISSRTQGFVCGGFAFGGLMAGLFAPIGKFGCAISFVIANSVMSLAFGVNTSLASVFIESLIGSVVFMLLPKEVGNIISPVFSNEKNASLGEALRKNVVMRLGFVSKAIFNVKNDVNQVSDRLKELYSPTFDWVCENVAKDVCAGCGLRTYCYEHEKNITKDDFFRLENVLSANGRLTENDVGQLFVKNCCKKGEIADSMNKNYREYLSALEAQQRVAEVRGVVAGQFSGISDILNDLSQEFKYSMRCDSDCADRITAALEELGISVIECVCLVCENGRMNVEINVKADGKIAKSTVMREVSKCCGRRFDLPTVVNEGNRTRLAMCEMPVYDVEIGSDQHIANNGKLCGDCLDYFNDGFGNTYTLVCDGMGTGGRAAVDGNMAVSIMGRLLRSGLTPDSSLQIVNSALMIKSEDESLSTVDVAGIDLFSGKLTLKKAGAPTTYIKRGTRIIKREMPSLPAGILSGIKFSTETVNLSTGDVVVMVSDGVITGDDKWLERLIKSWNEGSTQDLAQAVVDEAMKRRNGEREDDMTAVAIRLTENE